MYEFNMKAKEELIIFFIFTKIASCENFDKINVYYFVIKNLEFIVKLVESEFLVLALSGSNRNHFFMFQFH